MALVGPAALLVLLGLIVGGIAVFRAHQVGSLANEGARWASVHGPTYAKRTGRSVPSSEEIWENAMKPLAVSLRPECLTYNAEWNSDKTTVTVSVSYKWLTEVFGIDFELQGVTQLPVSY